MLESALEQLLLRFLAPYVDGISGDKLRVGVFRGSLELHALSIKAEAPSLLGLEGLRVRSGGIGRIQLKIPWNKLHTGKLRAVVEKVHLELEPIAEALARNSAFSELHSNLEAKLMQELRDAKSRAVDMRVEQMRDLIKQQSEDRLEGGNNYFVRLLRKILNNIHVDLSDLCIAFVTTTPRGLALGLELASLEVVSTDQTFRECLEEVNVSGQSLYKLLHLKGLALLVSPADRPSLLGAGYALSPSSVRLKLAHVPSDQTLRLQFEVATQEVTKVNFQRSQVMQILAVRSAQAEEVARLYRLMVPLEQENEILQDVAGASEEYAKLFEELVLKSTMDGNLKDDREKLQQLEDTLSVRLLARQRLLVYNKVDQLKELARRRPPEVEVSATSGPSVLPAISDKELQDMLREQDSKAEAVDLPQRLQFDLRLGQVSVNLVDDQRSDQAMQLLCWDLHEANCVVHIHLVTDHRLGRDAAEWRVEGKFADMQATHCGKTILCFRRSTGHSKDAAHVVLANRLEPTRNLLLLNFDFAPLEVFLAVGLVPSILRFFQRDADALINSPPEDEEPGKTSALTQDVVEKVYAQIPDFLTVDLRIASPVLVVPAGDGAARFGLGHLHLTSTEPCTYERMDFDLDLKDTSLRAVSARGAQFHVVNPLHLNAHIQLQLLPDETLVDIKGRVSQVCLCLSPQALQILLGCRSALTSLCPEDTNTPGGGATVSGLQPQLHVIANAMARTAASTRPIRLLLRSNLDGFEVTASDGVASVLRAQMVLGKPAVQAHVQSSPALFSLDADLRSLELDLSNSQGAWEPCLEPFSGMLQVERTNDGNNCTQQFRLIGRSPLLVNITPSMVHRTAWLWDAFSRATDVPAAGGRRPSNGGTAGFRVINICEFPMELGGQNIQGDVTSRLMVQPTGSLWEQLDDWVLPNFVTAVRVRLPQGDWSQELSLDCAGDVLVPGAPAAAEVLPDSSQRLIFLAPTLRLHNRTRFTLLLRFLDGSQKEVLMLHVPATALCDASLLGPSWPMPEETAEACDMESHSSLVGEDAFGGLLVLPPNSVGAVPMASFQGRRGSGTRSALAWLTVQPMSNPSHPPSAPFQVGARVRPQVAACSGLNLAVESTSLQGLSTTTICFRPPLVFINALPIGVLTIRFTVGDDGTDRTVEWQEVTLGKLSRLGAYAASYLVEEGLQMQLRLDQGPWSDTWHRSQGNASSLLQLRQREDGAAADVVVEVCGWEVRVSSPCCFMDRSGLCNPLSMDVMNGGRPLPQENGVSLLSAHGFQEHCELLLRSEECDVALIGLPSPTSWASFFWDTPCGYFALCLQVSEVDDGLDGRCQVITLRPRLVLTNSSAADLELLLQEGRLLRLASGQSIEAHWRPTGDLESGSGATLRFRPLPSEGSLGPWSGLIPCSDSWAGTFAVAISEATSSAVPEVWTVAIAPDCGALAVSLTQGSQFVARNSTASVLSLHPGGCRHGIVVPVGVDVPYGWPGPLFSPEPGANSASFDVDVVLKGSRWRIRDVRHTQEVHVAGGITMAIFRTEAQMVLQVSDCGGDESKSQSEAVWSQKVEVKLSRVGLSLILAEPMVELFYAQLEVIRLELRQGSEEAQQLRLSVAAAQVDCQLSNRVDARNGFGRSLPARAVLPAMIFANRGDGGRAFLSLYIQRASTSQDWVIPHAEVALDAADLTVDDGWLDPLADFLSQARLSASPGQSSISPAEGVCSALGSTLRLAGRPIVEEYVAPKCPRIVQLDALHVSSIRLVVWCSMRLQNARFLPSYVRAAIRLISLSGRFTLDGATLTLPRRSLPVSYRGSLHDLTRSLAAEYTVNLLRNVGTVLGKSSVLKLPRAPLKLAGTAMSLVTDGVGLAAGEAAALLNELTFDEEFVARQRQQQGVKQIRGIGDGVVEAGKSIAQGVEGLLDVVKKPVQGARSSGIGGFFAGVGLGVAGSLVKPVSRLGQAISDVGVGLAAEVSPDSTQRRRSRARRRHPRLICSTVVGAAGLGGKPPPQIRVWSNVEAEVLHQLGVERLRGLQEVIPLMQHNSKVTVLLLFATHCVVAEIDTEQGRHAAPIRRQSHRSYNFSDLKAVLLTDHVLQLVDENGSFAIQISQQYQAVLEAVSEELTATFQTVQVERSWAKVSLQLIEAKRRQRRLQDPIDETNQAHEGCGHRRLSVFEVERRMPGTSEWKTPFLPTDDDLSWRWVELQGRRHPYLPLGMTRSQAAASQLPPCRLGTLFHAASDWEVHHSAGRDREGWSYGIAWQSSSWEVAPGPLDTLRRRLWVRTFT